MAHDRSDQPSRQRYGNPDIGMLVLEQSGLGPAYIGIGNALECDRKCLDDEVIDGKLVGRLAVLPLWRSGINLFARSCQATEVAIHRFVEMRDGLYRGREPLRNGPAHVVMRNQLV